MKVFKIGNKKTAGIVVIYVTSRLTDLEHENILKLASKTDLAFVFPDHITKDIDVKKFSYLYGAVYYGLSPDNDEALGIWNILDYLHELSGYYSYSVILQEDLEELEDQDFTSIYRLQNSILETSVFTRRTLTNQELQDIYVLPRKQIKIWKYSISLPGYSNVLGMYSKFKTQDRVMFIRPISLTRIKKDFNFSPDILATFRGSGIKVLLPSLIPVKTYLNLTIQNAKL